MYDQTKESIALAGQIGMTKSKRKPTTDEILKGLLDVDAPYALTILVDLYNTEKDRLSFKIGDRVRVKKQYWYLGSRKNGWNGYTPMFADEIATVKQISWNPHQTGWFILTEYENPYRYVDYQNGEFYVETRPVCFMFYKDDIEKVVKEQDETIPTPSSSG